jgi:hypothetical protein
MKTTFSWGFAWAMQPFSLPTVEMHLEVTEESEEAPAPAPADQGDQA